MFESQSGIYTSMQLYDLSEVGEGVNSPFSTRTWKHDRVLLEREMTSQERIRSVADTRERHLKR